VEANVAQLRARGGAFEALEQPRAIQRLARVGVAEDQVAVGLVAAALEGAREPTEK